MCIFLFAASTCSLEQSLFCVRRELGDHIRCLLHHITSARDENMGGMCEHVNKLGVVLLAVDAFTRAEKECGCGIPCYRVTYEAELSYAHLSKLNVDRISLADDTKRSRVQKMFVEARETFQRVDRYNQNVAFSSFNYRTYTATLS